LGLLGLLTGARFEPRPAKISDHRFLARQRMIPSPAPEFDRRAALYERHAPVQREAAEWLAEWLPDQIEHPALELGAGTGLFTRHLVGRTERLVASDIAPRMVRAGLDTLPDAEWAVADAAAPPADRGYRWIFSCSLIQWLPDPAAAFRAWHRVATPGARLVAGWFVRGTLIEFFRACPGASPFVWRDAEEWNDLLAGSGWTIRRCERRAFVRHHADSAAMLREIHNAGAVIPRRIGLGKLRQALRRYDRDHRGAGGVRSTFEFMRVEAGRS
jgi:malonyl-CoA O-methyltransferase